MTVFASVHIDSYAISDALAFGLIGARQTTGSGTGSRTRASSIQLPHFEHVGPMAERAVRPDCKSLLEAQTWLVVPSGRLPSQLHLATARCMEIIRKLRRCSLSHRRYQLEPSFRTNRCRPDYRRCEFSRA